MRSLTASNALLAVAVLAATAGGCAGALPGVTEGDANRSGVSHLQLENGRSKYIDKCSGCHNLIAPGAYTALQWRGWVDEMADEAQLQGADKMSILSYLEAFSAR